MNDNLIVVGFGGLAGSGKTSAANTISPHYFLQYHDEQQKPIPIVWTKLSFAMPIKKIVSILTQTQGDNAFSRRCYQIHEALKELVGASVEYDELVDMVYEVCSQEIPESGKPRQFLQWIGTDLLRVKDDAVFVKWMRRQINYEYSLFQKQIEEDNQKLGIVIDDMRFENEIELIKEYSKHVVVKLLVEPEEAQRRLAERDGHGIESEHTEHPSERINTFPESIFDLIIDTNDKDIKAVTSIVLNKLDNILNPFSQLIFGIN